MSRSTARANCVNAPESTPLSGIALLRKTTCSADAGGPRLSARKPTLARYHSPKPALRKSAEINSVSSANRGSSWPPGIGKPSSARAASKYPALI